MKTPYPLRQALLPARFGMAKLALAAVLAVSAAGAFAAQTSASFSITSFAFQANGGTLTWNAPDDYQTLTAWSEDAGGIADYQTNTSTAFAVQNNSFVTTTAHASSNAGATAARTISGFAGAATSAYALTAQPNAGSSDVNQAGTFTLTGGTGSVTFNVGYTISVSAPGGNTTSTFANSNLAFTLGTYDGASGGTFHVDHYSFDTASGVATYAGVMSETVTFADPGDVGYYNLEGDAFASATAAVPEPSESALMLVGLAALGATAIKRRRRAS